MSIAMSMEAPAKRTLHVTVATASLIGTAIEWYDFFLYGTAAGLIFNKLFFPTFDPMVGTLIATWLMTEFKPATWPISVYMIILALITLVSVYCAVETRNTAVVVEMPKRAAA